MTNVYDHLFVAFYFNSRCTYFSLIIKAIENKDYFIILMNMQDVQREITTVCLQKHRP